MNKIRYIILLILMFPIMINASCDYKKLQEHTKLSNDIYYEIEYLEKSNKFNVKINNLYEGLYIKYNEDIYTGNSSNEVVIKDIEEGTNMAITVNSNARDCDSFIKSIIIKIEYYNEYYDSVMCNKYKDKLTVCSKKYLPYKINQSLFNNIISNYEKNNVIDDKKDEKKVEEKDLYDNVQDFLSEWGIIIILMILSALISSIIFRIKFRKIKHGI